MKKLITTVQSIIGDRPTVIMAGHFPIVLEETSDTLVPGIPQDCDQYPALQKTLMNNVYVMNFPDKTFDAGLELFKPGDQFCFLVNDWKFTPSSPDGNMEPRKVDFYKNYQRLPNLFQKKLGLKGLDIEKSIFRPISNKETYCDNNLYFSETRFRKEFINNSRSKAGAFANCKLGSTCAQEFLPFLLNLQQRGVKTFTVFIPSTCREATNEAIQTGVRDFGLTMDVISVIPDHCYALDAENFFNKTVVYVNGEYHATLD
jgi:hypothetical protein